MDFSNFIDRQNLTRQKNEADKGVSAFSNIQKK